MEKVDLKTKKNNVDVAEFINSIEDTEKRRDSEQILEIMKEATGERPVLWGDSIVGFGDYHYKYASGREGDTFVVGFSPRKQNLTIYIMPGYQDFSKYLKKLGPHKTGKACLYIKSLSGVDKAVLRDMIAHGVKLMRER